MKTAIDIISSEHRALAAVLSGLSAFVDGMAAGKFEPDFTLLAAMIDYVDRSAGEGPSPQGRRLPVPGVAQAQRERRRDPRRPAGRASHRPAKLAALDGRARPLPRRRRGGIARVSRCGQSLRRLPVAAHVERGKAGAAAGPRSADGGGLGRDRCRVRRQRQSVGRAGRRIQAAVHAHREPRAGSHWRRRARSFDAPADSSNEGRSP